METSAAGDSEGPRGYGLFGTRVLLIENDDAVQQATCALLSRWQCEVRTAASMAAALDAVAAPDWSPDIILADEHLDHDDYGTVTVAEIRVRLGRAVPAVIITADSSDATSWTAKSLGIELMRKPVKPAQLRALLAHLLA